MIHPYSNYFNLSVSAYIFSLVDNKKAKRGEVMKPKSVSFVAMPRSTLASTTIIQSEIQSSSAQVTSQYIHPTPTLLANIDRLSTIHQLETTAPRSSSLWSSVPHSVSVTTFSHTQRSPATSVAPTLENPSLKTTKPTSKTYENSATPAGRHGTMKLFRFILSFHIIREGMFCLHPKKHY